MKYCLPICSILLTFGCRHTDPPNWFKALPDDPAWVLFESEYDTMLLYNIDTVPNEFVRSSWECSQSIFLYRKSGSPDTIVEIGPGPIYRKIVFDSVGRVTYLLQEDCSDPFIQLFIYKSNPVLKSIVGYKSENSPIKGYDTFCIENINDSLSEFYNYSIKKFSLKNPKTGDRIYYSQKDSLEDILQSWLIKYSYHIYHYTHSINLYGDSGYSEKKSFESGDSLDYLVQQFKIENGLITYYTEYSLGDTSRYMYRYK